MHLNSLTQKLDLGVCVGLFQGCFIFYPWKIPLLNLEQKFPTQGAFRDIFVVREPCVWINGSGSLARRQ